MAHEARPTVPAAALYSQGLVWLTRDGENRNFDAEDAKQALSDGWTPATPATPAAATPVEAGTFPNPNAMSDERIEDEIARIKRLADWHPLTTDAKKYVSSLHAELQDRAQRAVVDTEALRVDVEERTTDLEALYSAAQEALATFLDAADAITSARPSYETVWSAAAKHGVTPMRVRNFATRCAADPDTRHINEHLRRVAASGW